MRLYCLEPPNPGPPWEPFHAARPLAELRAGAWRIRERWAAILGIRDVTVMGDHTPRFADADAAPLMTAGPVEGPAVVARSDFAPGPSAPARRAPAGRLTHQGRTVAWIVPAGSTWLPERALIPESDGGAEEIEGIALHGSWDLVTALERLLPEDCAGAATSGADPVPPGSLVLGDPALVASFGAEVEPGVVFDVRGGAVVLEEGARVLSGTRLEGPLFVGSHSVLLGGSIGRSAIGPHCRVRGETAASVFLGYANKSHDGFVGHSVIGQWVNLGAGTITSNLKNTYGEVRLELADRRVPTGRMFLGTLFGDHAKTGIGTLLSTGTIVGTGAQVLDRSPPRRVPAFSWNAGTGERLDADRFVTIAKRVMPRRQVAVSPAIEASLRAVHARLAR